MEINKRKFDFATNKLFILVFLFQMLQLSQQDQQEVYEPEKLVCIERCECRTTNDSLIMNCTHRNMVHVLNEWPPHSAHLIASFSWNNISELQQMPASDAETISLSFSHCGIKTLTSAMFIDAVGIEFLDLSWNMLTGQELRADVFRGRYSEKSYEPINLQQLDLSYNHIESLSQNLFEHTPNLTQLNLNHNPLQIIDIHTTLSISSLLKLSVLSMVNTSIEKIPEQMVSRLHKLRELDLSENKMKEVPLALGFLTRSLEILKLSGNPIEIFNDESFMGLHFLRLLNVSDMSELKAIRHNTFAGLLKLKFLHCSNNPKLRHIHREAFGIEGHKPPLNELYLSDNNLETLYQDQLHWSNLSVLELSGNRWLCNCELYHMLLEVSKGNDIMSPEASCSLPFAMAGVALNDMLKLKIACNVSTIQEKIFRSSSNPYFVTMNVILVLAVVGLCMIGMYTFWRVMLKYKTIRSINTLYPVVYISTSTIEH